MSNRLKQELTGVPLTMLLTTRSRVDEHQQPEGLFKDPMVANWWQTLTWDSALDPIYISMDTLG